MATKTTGVELKAFYNDEDFWKRSVDGKVWDIWHEGLILLVNGQEQSEDFSIEKDLQDDDAVTIPVGGLVYLPPDQDCSFESFFKKWRKQQNTAHLSVSVPKEKLEAVKAAIRAAGGSVY